MNLHIIQKQEYMIGLILKALNEKVISINGEFQKYTFTIRAYKNTGKSLIDVDLISSEAELMMVLNEEKIQLKNLSLKETYRLRKMEYNLRKKIKNVDRGTLIII